MTIDFRSIPWILHRRIRPALAALAVLGVVLPCGATSLAATVDDRVDNPYADADLYLDRGWVARVEGEAARVPDRLAERMLIAAQQATAVWIDGFVALEGSTPAPAAESEARIHRGLEHHLLAALEQQRPGVPLTISVVVYNLPDRDCAARASNGTLNGQAGIEAYQERFIDPIATLFADPRFATIRIVAILEPDSLPNLVTNLDMPGCAEAVQSYRSGIVHAIRALGSTPNVYVYLDMGHSGWLGWPGNRRQAVSLYRDIVTEAGQLSAIAGVATNVSGYTPVEEPFLADAERRVGAGELKMASFYEYNPLFDERDFAQALDAEFEAEGFPAGFGVLIDTSRNGWGGEERPTRISPSDVLDRHVDESRVDRRVARGHWCNQSGAGLGERPRAWPFGEGGPVDAFVWIKPPGESDGAASAEIAAQGPNEKGFDSNCAPSAFGDSGLPTGALPDAPPAGHWFPAQFRMLVDNAWPVLQSDERLPRAVDGSLARTLRAREALREANSELQRASTRIDASDRVRPTD